MAETGRLRSVSERMPVDRDGNPIPWLTYPAISFLSKRLRTEMTVFEYGSGNSTLWWSKRVSSLTSCEHDIGWFKSLKERLPANVEYIYRELEYGGEYCRVIQKHRERFDVIILDGKDRVNCAKNSLRALKDDGVVVWDDAERDNYREGYSFLAQNGFKRLDFEGFAPIAISGKLTSIFYRDTNCLGI